MGTDAADDKDAVGLPYLIYILDGKGEKPRKDPQSGIWAYPASALALEEVGLETIGYYIQVRRQHIAAYIVDRPIFGFCEEG